MEPLNLPSILRETERRYVQMALEATGNNKRAAARLLGIPRTTLIDTMRRHGFEVGPPIARKGSHSPHE